MNKNVVAGFLLGLSKWPTVGTGEQYYAYAVEHWVCRRAAVACTIMYMYLPAGVRALLGKVLIFVAFKFSIQRIQNLLECSQVLSVTIIHIPTSHRVHTLVES